MEGVEYKKKDTPNKQSAVQDFRGIDNLMFSSAAFWH
jgi:hypothetical protein